MPFYTIWFHFSLFLSLIFASDGYLDRLISIDRISREIPLNVPKSVIESVKRCWQREWSMAIVLFCSVLMVRVTLTIPSFLACCFSFLVVLNLVTIQVYWVSVISMRPSSNTKVWEQKYLRPRSAERRKRTRETQKTISQLYRKSYVCCLWSEFISFFDWFPFCVELMI